jgi:hypothetical protein
MRTALDLVSYQRANANVPAARDFEALASRSKRMIRVSRRRMNPDDVGFRSLPHLHGRGIEPELASSNSKRDITIITISGENSTEIADSPFSPSAIVEWYTHGKYRHNKHCPSKKAGPGKACTCRYKAHQDTNGQWTWDEHGNCTTTDLQPNPDGGPTTTPGNGTMSILPVPSSIPTASSHEPKVKAGFPLSLEPQPPAPEETQGAGQ